MDLHVETEILSPAVEKTASKPTLAVETFGLKACSVRITSLESILFSNREEKPLNKTHADPTPQSDTSPKPPSGTPVNALGMGSTASDNKGQKRELDTSSTAADNDTGKPHSIKPTQGKATDPPSAPSKKQKKDKASKKLKKYRCRMCDTQVDTAQELKEHHQGTHGIMYCKMCRKAFNNQLSLT